MMMEAMQSLLAMYGPDSVFGWLVLLFLSYLPLLALCALVLGVIFRVTRGVMARYQPPDPPARTSVLSDPEAMASRLRESAQNRRGRPRDADPGD